MPYSNPATQDDLEKLKNELAKKLDYIMEKLDWLVGKFFFTSPGGVSLGDLKS